MTPQHRRIAVFIAVGCAAAGVHLMLVIALVGHAGWQPLAANVVGWLLAFIVSFAGHWRFTFRAAAAPAIHAAPRFFLVSAAGFAANEATYALGLHFTALRYEVVLFMVLVAVATGTYVLSSRWAFPGTRRRG